MRRGLILQYFLAVVLLWALPAVADEVRLADGSRIIGEIVNMEQEVLHLKTTFAGEINVAWVEVMCLNSDKDHTFVLMSQEVFTGQATCPSHGNIQIVDERIGQLPELSLGDVTVINPSPPAPAISYKASVTAGGSVNTGNTDSKAGNASAKFEGRSKRHRFSLTAKHNYAEDDDELTARKTTGSLKYDFFLTQVLYVYAQALFERDDMQDVNLRSAMGPGLGYQVLDSERANLFAEVGVSYFNEDYEEVEDQHYTSGRWSVGLDYELLPERVKFFHLHEGYYGFDESDSYYIRSEQGFRFLLIGNLFANFELDYDYNNRPLAGKEKSDATYIFGLAYEQAF
jgi:putative salt-induced outer membrane protein YdiY